MKINTLENGKVVIREMTAEEIAKMERSTLEIPYKQRVALRIRAKYSIDDEMAILRQRDTKPEEFKAYNDYVEACKSLIRYELDLEKGGSGE